VREPGYAQFSTDDQTTALQADAVAARPSTWSSVLVIARVESPIQLRKR
jgi:hypothetical protein